MTSGDGMASVCREGTPGAQCPPGTSAGSFRVTAPPVSPTCSSAAPQTATVAVNAMTQRVYAYAVQNATTVQFPTWWLSGHQADIQWLNGTNAGSGTWYADVPLSQFDAGNPRYGDFKTDVYMSNSGFANVFCAHTFWTWTLPAPTVSSFTPSSGPIYSTVTINGANFSSTLAEDIVTFNAQPAAITAASATQLTVAVPSGATSGPINLTINGQTVNVGYFTLTAFNYDGSLFDNACQFNDPKLLSVLQSEAFLVQQSILTQNPDGTYNLAWQPYTSFAGFSGPLPLDMSSLFYSEPQATAGRSAFLIGPNLMMTAPHAASSGANSFDVSQFAVVFGMSPGLVSGSGYQTYICQFPSFANIPSANVYFPDMTRPVINTWTSTAPTYDYEAFYLTQSPNRPYVRLRRSGGAHSGDPAAEIGHPERLTTKISPAIELFGLSSGTVLLNGGHSFGGSSGSMIYNLAHDYVETVVAEPPWTCAQYQLVNGGPNYKMVLGCSLGNYSVNYPVADVASGIPAFSLITSPESDVLEQIAVGGTASTTYTLAAPTTASAPISWQIAAPTGLPTGAPAITFAPATTSGTLPIGSSYQFVSNVGSANTCGKFDETFKVYDNTNGFADSLTHHIEVGLTEFAVTPSDGFALQKMLPPYNGVAKTYSLINPRPTAVGVRVSSANWVDLSSQQGSRASVPSPTPIMITLGPAGSSTATANVFVRVDETRGEAFTPGVEVDATVTFANTSTTCAVITSTSRTVQFTPGKQEYDKFDPTLPGVWAGTIDETISVPDNFAIGTVAVDVGLYDFPQAFIPYDFTSEQIVLISPTGQRLTLWDGNAAPTGNYYSAGFNADVGDQVGTLHIDDTLSPSPVGTHLSALQGQSATGTWTLEITGSGGGAFFADWALRFTLLYCPNCQ